MTSSPAKTPRWASRSGRTAICSPVRASQSRIPVRPVGLRTPLPTAITGRAGPGPDRQVVDGPPVGLDLHAPFAGPRVAHDHRTVRAFEHDGRYAVDRSHRHGAGGDAERPLSVGKAGRRAPDAYAARVGNCDEKVVFRGSERRRPAGTDRDPRPPSAAAGCQDEGEIVAPLFVEGTHDLVADHRPSDCLVDMTGGPFLILNRSSGIDPCDLAARPFADDLLASDQVQVVIAPPDQRPVAGLDDHHRPGHSAQIQHRCDLRAVRQNPPPQQPRDAPADDDRPVHQGDARDETVSGILAGPFVSVYVEHVVVEQVLAGLRVRVGSDDLRGEAAQQLAGIRVPHRDPGGLGAGNHVPAADRTPAHRIQPRTTDDLAMDGAIDDDPPVFAAHDLA